ncbi:MAG: thioredoxin family protein [Bacteroidetes bacterium]|nr:MAG: thioredoxin family protein [Bacteroidota bacterium]
MEIIIFGSGCKRCEQLEQACRDAVTNLNITADIKKEQDMNEIIKNGVLLTPGLMINGKLMASGKIPTHSTLENWIRNAQ